MGSTTVPPSSASSPVDPIAWGAEKLAVFADLATPARRKDAARALATALGAEDLIIFTPDPELGILLPAPGFPQTLPGGAAWQALLRSALAAGRAFGPVTPLGGERAKVSLAVAGRDGSALVLIGCTEEDGEVAWCQSLLPLLAGTFRGERMALTAEGHAAVARAAASQAEALAESLDRVRRELGEALARAKATADENARLYAEVRDADRRKDEFLATLAHELRNPLAPVRNGLQVLKLAPPGPTTTKTRDMMERQLTHMVHLIDDLLDVSRISRGKVELKRERVRVQSLVDAAVEASRPAIDAGQHEFTVTLPDEPLWLDVDPTRIAQVISNLLTNAAKYTPDGGRIDLTARREGGEVLIEVRDNGVGIPADMLPKVFEMFTQVGRTLDRAQGGLGIGLSLVRRLAEMHGGTAEAKSEGQNQGSTFTVRLLLAAGGGLEDHTPEPEAAAKVQERKRILVVDDNEDGAESLSMLLQYSGHDTRTANSGPEALAAAKEYRPDVVFLDIGLPGMNGYEVARRLRQEASLSRAVLVALTGWGTEDDKRQAMDAGFDYHLTKPVESKAVEAVLIESCGRG